MITRRVDADFDMTFGHGLVNYLEQQDAIGQNIRTRLLLILGEWFLDITEGTPWRSILGVKPFDTNFTETALRQRILKTEGVTAITAFEVRVNPTSRKSVVSATVRTIYATSITVEVSPVV